MKYVYHTPEMNLIGVSHEDVIRTSDYHFSALEGTGDGSVDRVSVKATTEEHLGFTGEKLGIASHAVCLLYRD